MSRPCACDRCERDRPWARGQCHLCWLYHNDARYRDLWDNVPTRPVILPRPECVHLGAVTNRLDCNCPQKWERSCDHPAHTTTTLIQCAGCTDYDADVVSDSALP